MWGNERGKQYCFDISFKVFEEGFHVIHIFATLFNLHTSNRHKKNERLKEKEEL